MKPDPTTKDRRPGSLLGNISVVLVEPGTPGNIGAVARVLKNTGIGHLSLVNPGNWDLPETRWMAHASGEILDNCTVFPDLGTAVRNANLVIGTTCRAGRLRELEDDYRSLLREACDCARSHRVALVFGRERDGLWSRELDQCHWLLRIPAAVPYPSFNLSHAVLLVAYELFHAVGNESHFPPEPGFRQSDLATAEQTERVIRNVLDAMATIGFKAYNDDPGSFARVLRRFLTRTPLERRDAMVIHRICSQIRKFSQGLRRGV